MTLILREDTRSRTSRATETTQFLAREQKRYEAQLSSLDTQIAEFKQQNRLVRVGASFDPACGPYRQSRF